MNLYFDIETIPCQRPEYAERVRENIKPPANIKKAESIALWMEDEREKAVAEKVAKSSFEGGLGEVVCISYAIGEGDVKTLYRDYKTESDAEVVKSFFEVECENVRLVGHNIKSFDIPFLVHRATVLGLKAPHWLTDALSAPPSTSQDTMLLWCGAYSKDHVKMDDLAFMLGLPGKGDIDGSDVWPMCQEGRIEEVAEYCARDVEVVRAIWRRIAHTRGV